jgi:hypothetical protein
MYTNAHAREQLPRRNVHIPRARIDVRACTYQPTRMRIHMPTHIHVHIHTYIHVSSCSSATCTPTARGLKCPATIFPYAHAGMYVCLCVCMLICGPAKAPYACVKICVRVYALVCTYVLNGHALMRSFSYVCECISVCMRTCV